MWGSQSSAPKGRRCCRGETTGARPAMQIVYTSKRLGAAKNAASPTGQQGWRRRVFGDSSRGFPHLDEGTESSLELSPVKGTFSGRSRKPGETYRTTFKRTYKRSCGS